MVLVGGRYKVLYTYAMHTVFSKAALFSNVSNESSHNFFIYGAKI